MASPIDIIQAIIKLGTSVKSAAGKSGSKDWSTVLGAIVSDSTVSKTVSDLFSQLKGKDSVDSAISVIVANENTILQKANAKDAMGLSGKDLLDYHSLTHAEMTLATQGLINQLDAGFLDWLVNDAVPALTTVLPLLMAL